MTTSANLRPPACRMRSRRSWTAGRARRSPRGRAGRFEPRCERCGEPLAPELVPEEAPLGPRNVYAATKVAQEHLAGSWARATEGQAVALRYHNVYGPGMPRDTPYAGVASFFRSALAAGRAPRVFEDGAPAAGLRSRPRRRRRHRRRA